MSASLAFAQPLERRRRPRALIATPLIARGIHSTRSELEERGAYDLEGGLLWFVAMLDESKRARYLRFEASHAEIRWYVGNRHVGHDGHAEIRCDNPLHRLDGADVHRRVPQDRCLDWTPTLDEAKAEGLRLAKLAGDANNGDPMVLTALGATHSVIGDLERASALIEKAMALGPNSAVAWNRSGWVNAFLDRPETAIEHFERAIRLSPFHPMNFNYYFGTRNAHFAAVMRSRLPGAERACSNVPSFSGLSGR